MTDIDQRVFRDTLGSFCTGVVAVTGMDNGQPVGFAAQSFTSVSLDPPLVAVCPGKGSTSWPRIRAGGCFCINILGEDQRTICDTFARTGIDKFAEFGWRTGVTGAPILERVIAYIDCRLEVEHDAGDHTIAVGRVVDLATLDDGRGGLLFFRGSYGRFCPV